MYAIVAIGGKQHRIEPGQAFETERMKGEPGDVIRLDDSVLMLRTETEIKVGQPAVPGASVDLEIVNHLRGKKVTVFKMKRRKRNRRKQGHRQELTRVLVKDLCLDGASLCEAPKESEPEDKQDDMPAAKRSTKAVAAKTKAKKKTQATAEEKPVTEKPAKADADKPAKAKKASAKTPKKSTAKGKTAEAGAKEAKPKSTRAKSAAKAKATKEEKPESSDASSSDTGSGTPEKDTAEA